MFDLYALALVPVLLVFLGIIGYLVKSKIFKTTNLNSYFLGLITYFSVFELISIPSIFSHISFNSFKIIQIIVAIILFTFGLITYYRDYKVKHINHKYRFLQRYTSNKFLFQFIFIILVVFIVLFLFFPFTRLRDDDLHWIIAIKDNIHFNKLLQIYPENGTSYKFAEMYAFNAYILFYSFVVSIFKVDTLAFVLVTIRAVWLFNFLFSIKDLMYSFALNKFIRNYSFVTLVLFTLLWTIFNNFYDVPFIITNSSVGQRLLILILIPLLQMLLHNFNNPIKNTDYLLYSLISITSIFFATSTAPLLIILVGYFVLVYILNKKLIKIWPLILFIFIIGILSIITAVVYLKYGPASNWLENILCINNNCTKYNASIQWYTMYENWPKVISSSYLVRFLIPISIVVWSKRINVEFKFVAWFLIMISVLINPFFITHTKNLIPFIFIDRLNNYFTFFGYLLYYPAISHILKLLRTKSDIIKLFQIILFGYLCLSTFNVDLFKNRNFNIMNTYIGPFYSELDWDDDGYYPIDKYQVQALDRVKGYYNGSYYVFSTSAQMINYRYRLFDPNARIITPRNREHWTINYKDSWNECLNTSHFIGKKDLNVCINSATHYKNTIILLYNSYNNNFKSYVNKTMKKVYENEKYTIYKFEK